MSFRNIVNKLCSQFDSKAYDQDILKYGHCSGKKKRLCRQSVMTE